MGRELQKRKNKSSISKVTRKPKSKKQLLQNPIIAANWDKSQTLAQNYRRLGLTTKLNKITGGVEKNVSSLENEGEDEENGLRIDGRRKKAEMELSEAKIERDPTTGRILRVLDDETARPNPLNDPLNDLDSESEDEVEVEEFDQHGNMQPALSQSAVQPKTEVIEQLEERANNPAPKYRRQQSEGERAFVVELVKKYGDDYGKMARDTKINYMQRSEGDLKRRVKKWKESGGVV